jgi:cytochrome c biogenesis protein CcdA
MELSLLVIFWYGILHAFAPDHLTVIADFSIGKNSRRTMLITALFAMGHGVMLFAFAKFMQYYHVADQWIGYGNLLSASVILLMGVYLLYMVYADKIHLRKHLHEGQEHVHIYFGKEHAHENNVDTASVFAIGALMGIGGVRGMLVTLGAVQGQNVGIGMLLAFTLGVMIVFVGFGVGILYINKNLLHNKRSVRRMFATAGAVSVLVGGNMLIADEPLWGHSHGAGTHTHTHSAVSAPQSVAHTHSPSDSTQTVNQIVQRKHASHMTYKQMMQQMGESFKMVQTGLLTQNSDLIRLGADLIQHHPAPKTKPWLIMPEEEQEAFRESLIAYDKLLHQSAGMIIDALDKDIYEVNNRIFEMSNHCISCHQLWQNKTIK